MNRPAYEIRRDSCQWVTVQNLVRESGRPAQHPGGICRTEGRSGEIGGEKGDRTSMACIFPFINWFSVAARSIRSFVRSIGLRERSISL